MMGSEIVEAKIVWPGTVLSRTIRQHFEEFEGFSQERASNSTDALLDLLRGAGIADD